MKRKELSTTAAGGLLVAVLLLAAGLWPARAADEPAAESTARVVIDYGDGVEKHFTALPVAESTTAADLLLAAGKHPRGVKLRSRGRGENFFVEAIDDAVGGARVDGERAYWTYRVNGEIQNVGAGVREIGASDLIRWRYGPFERE